MDKDEMIKKLIIAQGNLTRIVVGLELLSKSDKRTVQTNILTEMFELMDTLGSVEPEIYNYLKKEGW